jgi:hypothetical protein
MNITEGKICKGKFILSILLDLLISVPIGYTLIFLFYDITLLLILGIIVIISSIISILLTIVAMSRAQFIVTENRIYNAYIFGKRYMDSLYIKNITKAELRKNKLYLFLNYPEEQKEKYKNAVLKIRLKNAQLIADTVNSLINK